MGGSLRAHRFAPRGLAAWLLAVVAVVLVWGVQVAVADTTVVGEPNLVSNSPNADATGQNIPVFQGDASGGYVLSSPRSGSITSWSFLSGGVATGKHFELAVLAPTDQSGQGWRLVAVSAPVAVSTATGTDAVNGPFAVSIPVDVGQRIALLPTDDSSTPIETGTAGVDGIRYFSQPFSGGLGSSQSIAPGSTADNGQVVPIQASITFSGPPAPPANIKAPSISGAADLFETLNGDPGLWQNGVTRFAYSWLRCGTDGMNCVAVPNSGSDKYTLSRADVGFTMRLRVIASNAGGDSQPVLSAPTAVVQLGVVTAKLTVSPDNPDCTGIPTTFDASGSHSPDGIKSYSFRIMDLYTAVLALVNHYTPFDDEGSVELYTTFLAANIGNGTAPDLPSLIDRFAGPPATGTDERITYTFDWNRTAIYHDTQNSAGVSPGDLARDDTAVVLDVTDFAGHTAQAVVPVFFAQHLSSHSRAKCPKPKRPLKFILPNAVLTAGLAFPKGSSQPSTTANCQTRVACIGSITVALRVGRTRATKAAAKRSVPVLASAFFKIPAHRKRKVVLKLTSLGKSRLHHGSRVPVRVTLESVSPTGRAGKHVYSQVLAR